MIIATLPPPMRPIALALHDADLFIGGFQGDESQEGIEDLQDTLRRAAVVLERTGRLVDLVFQLTFTSALVGGAQVCTISDAQMSALRDACLTLRDGLSFTGRDDAPDEQAQSHRAELAQHHRQSAARQGGRHLVAAGDRDRSLPGAMAYLTINGIAYDAQFVAAAVLRAGDVTALVKADQDYDAAWEDWKEVLSKYVRADDARPSEERTAASARVTEVARRRREALARLAGGAL
ncbi:hypothetical protein ABZR86_02410 [Dyella marensis]|uniref:Uncharacterized protein n=1 Tax=Dyella marensis TaxID=500610 RepID=A0A1I2A494_9GAMM|nr:MULTISPECIES: hypothetical protein [Dyella]SFE37713.1 hypothetical protein SAMN02799615_00889 [Dyella marensis]